MAEVEGMREGGIEEEAYEVYVVVAWLLGAMSTLDLFFRMCQYLLGIYWMSA